MPHTRPETIQAMIERIDGPALVAYCWDHGEASSELRTDTLTYDWHHHARGQLICIESGLVHCSTRHGSWLMPPHRAGWMPPGEEHTVTIRGSLSAWGVFITPAASAYLPAKPCVLGVSELMRALVRRASDWAAAEQLDDEQARLMAVLLDELRHAPQEPLYLPLPIDRRLRRVTEALLEQPHDNRGTAAWARWAGLSERSLTRLFRSETGLNFSQWRQQARLSRALEQLADGESVSKVADALGYASVSAFVAMFRRSFGHSPARYFAAGIGVV